jgi:phytoene desaturase
MKKHVVVIGAGQGGLSAAVHLRLKGHHVLVIRDGPLGGKAAAVQTEGYRLDPGPSIVILPKLYKAVFDAAGRKMEDYLRFQRLDPISRVFFEGIPGPIDLPADPQACLDLVQQIEPQDRQPLASLLDDLDHVAPHIDRSVFSHPYHSAWQLADPHLIATALRFDVRKTYRELVDGMFRSPLLRAFFYGFPSYGGQTYDSKAPGALMIPYFMLRDGVYYPEGGVAAIPAAFARLAQELGVEFRQGKATGLRRKGSAVTHVELASGDAIEADAVVANADRLQVHKWLSRNTDIPPSLSYFTVHWGVRAEFTQLEHHTLLIPNEFEKGFADLYRRRVFPEPPIVYLNATSKLDQSAAPPGRTNLFAVVTSPAQEPHLNWNRDAPKYRQRVVEEMAKFDIQVDEVDFERIQSPNVFQMRDGNHRGSLYGPDEAHRLFGGIFPLRCRDEEIRNLFYCGGSVQPGAGLPMVTLSGKFAAELV